MPCKSFIKINKNTSKKCISITIPLNDPLFNTPDKRKTASVKIRKQFPAAERLTFD